MHRTLATALAFIGFFILALALDYPFNALPLPVKPAVFTGEMDGQAYELNGTVHQVQDQLKLLHPSAHFSKREVELTNRNKDGATCLKPADGMQGAVAANILECIDALPEMARITAPGGTCVNICCLNGDRIWLCNFNELPINPAAAYLASYAADISSKCTEVTTDPGTEIVGGQESDSDGYSVVVLGFNGEAGQTC